MVMVPTKYNVTEMTEKLYDVKECKPVETQIIHKKKIPDCKNVTKHHCVTKWEIIDGEKVGNCGISLIIIFIQKILTKFLPVPLFTKIL